MDQQLVILYIRCLQLLRYCDEHCPLLVTHYKVTYLRVHVRIYRLQCMVQHIFNIDAIYPCYDNYTVQIYLWDICSVMHYTDSVRMDCLQLSL